jgi:hypothetical protein
MTSDRRKPGVAFWAIAVLFALLVACPLSFGPACWINERFGVGSTAIAIVYRPIIWLASNCRGVRRPAERYASAGSRRFSMILNGKIEWSDADWTELIILIQSIQPSTGDLVDGIDIEDAEPCRSEL